jgi:hypothetical protein
MDGDINICMNKVEEQGFPDTWARRREFFTTSSTFLVCELGCRVYLFNTLEKVAVEIDGSIYINRGPRWEAFFFLIIDEG